MDTSDIKLIKADTDGATLQVVGAGKYNNDYYIFDSMPFGSKDKPLKEGIARFSVVYPEGRVRTFYNVTATQSIFSQATKDLSTKIGLGKKPKPIVMLGRILNKIWTFKHRSDH